MAKDNTTGLMGVNTAQIKPIDNNDGVASVVITCFNHAAWLAEAIDSVLAQTYQPAEVIVVDDGSIDDAVSVCRRYPSVRHVWQCNAGLSAARNTGLREAVGRFICFLDADDLLMPDALEHGVRALTAHRSWAFVYGGHLLVTADRKPIEERRPRPQDACYRALLRRNVIEMHAAVLYRREILAEVGGFDTALKACEDYDVYLRIARKHAVGCYGQVVAHYRRHIANMSSDTARMLINMLAVLKAQSASVQDSVEDAQALRDGQAFYQDRYGRWLILEVLRDARKRQRRINALKRLLLVLQLAPRAFPSAAVDAVRVAALTIERRLPMAVRRYLRSVAGREPPVPPVGRVGFGDLRRVQPIDRGFGFSRGKPIDRFYIEDFLERNMDAIAGRVLEIGDNSYTLRFGGHRVARSDVLHVSANARQATIVGDLADAAHIESDSFDCIILTQTLHLIFDMPRAVATLHRILKPGGVLLLTVPGTSQTDRGEWGESWYWSLTAASVRRLLLAQAWSEVVIEVHGNVLSAASFLYGLAAEELTRAELESRDPAYQLIIAARAVKSAGARAMP